MDILWYIFLGILELGLLLLLIAVLKTIFVKDKPYVGKEFEMPLDKQMKYALGLKEMIKVKTIANKQKMDVLPFSVMQNVMAELFPLVHKNLEKTVFEGGSMIFKWKGLTKGDPIIFMAHQDVVPAEPLNWTDDPFCGKIENGEIYGRGTFDTKSTLYAFFQATEELLEEGFVPNVDVYLASSSDEEVSGTGAETTVEWLEKNNVKPALVLDEGGAIVQGVLPSMKRPIALIGVLEKGYVNIKVKAISHGGHSSTPPKNTPLARLAFFISDVEKHFPLKTKMIKEVESLFTTASTSMSFLYRMLFGNMWLFKGLITKLLPVINSYGRAMLSTTIAFTMAKGSEAENVIPSDAYVLANLRTHPIQDIQASYNVLNKIAKKYNVELEILEGRESTPIVNTSAKSYKFLEKQIKASFPDVLISPYVILGGTDARHYTKITDAALRFSPVRVTNADLKKMHGINESIRIDALAEAVKFYEDFMRNYQ